MEEDADQVFESVDDWQSVRISPKLSYPLLVLIRQVSMLIFIFLYRYIYTVCFFPRSSGSNKYGI